MSHKINCFVCQNAEACKNPWTTLTNLGSSAIFAVTTVLTVLLCEFKAAPIKVPVRSVR